jgi:hypothetical protein
MDPSYLNEGIAGCPRCSARLAAKANFCSACGSPRSNGATPPPTNGSSAAPTAAVPPKPRLRRSAWVVLIAALAVFAVMLKIGMFGTLWRGLTSGMGMTSLDLSIEIRKGSGLAAHSGYIIITNLAEEPVILRTVSINHRKDAACLFGGDGAPLASSPLAQGENIMLGTVGSVFGGCGSIVVVTVSTDKGSEDYAIEWH